MQEARPYKTWLPLLRQPNPAKKDFNLNTPMLTELPLKENVISKLVSDHAVVVFGRRGCCLCHVVERLLQGLGANAVVHEIEENDLKHFNRKNSGNSQFPEVFIGGVLYGGLDRVIASHISGELVPMLKQAGALWL